MVVVVVEIVVLVLVEIVCVVVLAEAVVGLVREVFSLRMRRSFVCRLVSGRENVSVKCEQMEKKFVDLQ